MANTIKLKNASGSDPSASDLVLGELAVRTDTGKIFLKKDNGNVAEVSGGGGVEDGDKGDITVSNSGDTWTIDAGAIDNANINSSAAIAGSKISPDFGNQAISGRDITLTDGDPAINFVDSGDNPDYQIVVNSGHFMIKDSTAAADRLYINASSTTITNNLNVSSGLDVTGNITVTGTVDGVDIAARNTLFGGLTSSSGVLTNGVTATTQSASDNSTKVATTAYTDTAISNLVDSSPSALNTLNELAAALGDDANFSTTVTNSIATKAVLSGSTNNTICTVTGANAIQGEANLTFANSGSDPVLTVTNSGHAQLQLTSTGGTDNCSVNFGDNADADIGEILYNHANNFMRFYVNGTEAIDIISDGKVGIGLASPTEALDVVGNIKSSGTVTATTFSGTHSSGNIGLETHATGSGVGAQLKLHNDHGVCYVGVAGDTSGEMIVYNEANTALKFYTNGGSPRLTIAAGGAATFSGSVTATGGFSGSGASLTNVNATTLDSIDSGSFLRSDADDTATGAITFAGSHNEKIILQGAGNAPYINFKEGTTQKAYIQWEFNGYFQLRNTEDSSGLRIYDSFTFTNDSSNWHSIWHAGNDGSGSGLDADTLDGQQGSHYAPVAGSSSFRPVTAGLYGTTHASSLLPVWQYDSGHTGYGFGYIEGSPDSWVFDVSGGLLGNTPDFRIGENEAKINGNTVWHAGNDGAGSGLDADTLDGTQLTNLLRKDAADSVSTYSNFTQWYSNNSINSGGGSQASLECFNGSAGNDAFMAFHVSGDYALYFGLDGGTNALSVGGWSMGANSYKVWHQATDGAGSGLDADTVDGISSASFLRSDTSDNCSGTITFDAEKGIRCSHGQQTDGNDGFIASGKFGTGLNIVGTQTSSGTGRQVRLWGNLITNSGDTYWVSSNDGAGSGLDADTLDGLHASQIGGFPSGTRMIFQQTSAPSGWTKDTSDTNQRALRVVSGTAGSGGSVDFTTAFASNRGSSSNNGGNTNGTNGGNTGGGSATTGGRSLTEAQLNQHRHKVDTHNEWSGDYGHHTTQSWRQVHTGGTGYLPRTSWTGSSSTHNHGGGSHTHSTPNHAHTTPDHSHTTNVAVRYLDVIIASKD